MDAVTFDYQIYRLSDAFYDVYNHERYPEILMKNERPYNCLLIETEWDFFICLPFRTEIHHNQAYKFKNSSRSLEHNSGLDFSKMIIIRDITYLGEPAVIDQDEYNETRKEIRKIIRMAVKYLKDYVQHQSGKVVLAEAEFQRKYRYTTLKYFYEEIKDCFG